MNNEEATTQTNSPDIIDESFSDAKFMQDSSERARRISEQPDQSIALSNKSETELYDKKRKRIAVALAGLSISAGIAGLSAMEGGTSNGESRGDVDGTIQSITLNPDAHLRFDPFVGSGENNNEVLNLGATIEINAANDIRVLEGTNNGTWYGIPTSDIKDVIPDLDTKNDKDNIIWVNEQGVAHIDRLQLPTE